MRCWSTSFVLASVSGLAIASVGLAHGGLECMHAKAAAVWSASDGDGFEEATGADTLNYAPDREADVLHMTLRLDIPDMNTPRLTAVEDLRFAPIGDALEVLELNAVGFEIGEIAGRAGAEVKSIAYDGDVLQIRFAEPIPPGQEAGVRIEYALNDPADGLFWTPQSEAWGDRAAQIHTQGQPETNRFWFASHDYPNERMTTALIVTVPEGYEVSGNGRLVEETSRDGRTTFHWLQDTDHVSYLVSLVVGKFDVVDVGTDALPMPVYVPPGRGGDVEGTYGMTADMVRVFEERFDEPYPWDRYAQLVVWNFGAGGMENTSATTMYDTAIYDEKGLLDDDLEGLIAHELGHQWFGDLITCNRWADIWLNEGFATYSTALWYEARDGWDEGYLRSALSNFDRVTRLDTLDPASENAGLRPALVSRAYEHPWEVFRRRANPYPKGASVLHMLRMRLGDEVFFDAVAEYVDRFKFDTVETADFRRVVEEVSGESLDRFFEQWAHRPGVPSVTVRTKWDEAERSLGIEVEQTQRIDRFVPAFAFTLPVRVYDASGNVKEVEIDVSQRRHERSVSLDGEPRMVVVDPECRALMDLTVEAPASWMRAQLREGPTVPSRIRAARTLSIESGQDAVNALIEALQDENESRHVRTEAAEALGEHGAFEALIDLAGDGDAEPRVRAAAIEGLRSGDADTSRALGLYRSMGFDRSAPYGVQREAIRALGEHGGERQDLGVITEALEVESRDDEVRQAALRALEALDEPEGLELAIPYTRLGTLNRTRPVAIGAVAALSGHDKERAYEAIAPLLSDREHRARSAAARALVEIEDERGIEVLRRVARTHEHEGFRETCAESADRLAAAIASQDDETDTLERIERLERELESLRGRVEEK